MRFIKNFIKLESSGGVILGIAALFAILLKNSAAQNYYDALINFPLAIHIGDIFITKPAVVWVNDLLMAIFFLLIGLELKRECLEGELATKANRTLPALAALGGVIFPALIYVYFSWGSKIALKGWAIPTATDIAFALGVLALLGDRVPRQLKVCLLSLAIFDDITTILVIVLFYNTNFSCSWLLASSIPLCILFILNKRCIKSLIPYMVVGFILWCCTLKSGIHATIAGFLLALFIPLRTTVATYYSPLKYLEYIMHPWVSFGVLPIFAFFNAGVSLEGFSLASLTHPVALGTTVGLFVGKQLGVMLFSMIGIQLKWCSLPKHVTWLQYYGMAVITGIGFTMSLFVGIFAFSEAEYETAMRLGVILGSILSGGFGYIILLYALRKTTLQSLGSKPAKR